MKKGQKLRMVETCSKYSGQICYYVGPSKINPDAIDVRRPDGTVGEAYPPGWFEVVKEGESDEKG